MKISGHAARVVFLFLVAAIGSGAVGTKVTVKGYVLDSSCAFTKGIDKPVGKECAIACANGGSQIVILADDGTIYWPISGATPATGENSKLLPFAGEKVTATGMVYQRGGSKAIVIETIEPQAAEK